MNTKTISQILLLAFVYFISAKIGQVFAIGPGNVTSVWFPSGIIFFAILWKGYKLLPGVFLGAAIGNGWAYISFEDFDKISTTVSAAVLNGIGDTLCAFVGVYFLKRITTIDNFFNSMSSIFSFFIYAVLFGPFISALFGVAGLSFAGLISNDEAVALFVTWLVGDSVGVLLFAPILISLYQNNWKIKYESRIFVFFIFLAFMIFISRHMPIINQFDMLHILIILIPLLIYITFKYNQLISLQIATISSLIIIFSIAMFYQNLESNELNQVLVSLQLFIFLLFSILIFFITIINILHNEEKKRISQHELMLKSQQHSIGEMISMIAHQWRQPLSIISMSANNIQLDIELDDFEANKEKKQLFELQKQVKYLSNTLDDFKKMHDSKKANELVSINEPIIKATNLLKKTYENNNIALIQDFNSKIKLSILEGEIIQVILNILNNARYILIERKINNPKVYINTKETEHQVQITIGDNGGGIDKIHIDKIFDAYYTTKNEVNKSGLGLYMSKIIIEENFKGKLEVHNTKTGAEFIITLPLE